VLSVLLLITGLAGLLIGAELLVRGGSKLAIRLGVTPIVIGLTVVSIGTSMPELAIGIDARVRAARDWPWEISSARTSSTCSSSSESAR
jgi:cation:H+ antiporter